MSFFDQVFDASTVEPSSDFEVLPAGKYLVQIVSSEMRPTRDGRGQYLNLELDVLEGQLAGRKLFDRLNLVNDNAEAVDIARRTLSQICRATGQMQIRDSQQLHFIPMIADVRVRPPKGQYGESNSVRYLPRTGTVTASQHVTAPQQVSAPQPTAPQQVPPQATAVQPAVAPHQPAPVPSGAMPWQR